MNPAERLAAAGFPPLFDSHTHLVSADFGRYPLNFQGQPPAPGVPPPTGVEELRARIQSDPPSLEKMLGWWDAHGVTGGCGVQYRTAYGTDNTYLLACSDAQPERVTAVVLMNANDPASPAQLADWAVRHGVAAVRLTGFRDAATGTYPWFDSEAASALWRVVDDLGLTVVMMYLPPGGLSDADASAALARIGEIAERYPNAMIELDHMGWPKHEGAPGFGLRPEHHALVARPNVVFKFTTITMEDCLHAGIPIDAALRAYVDVFGAGRVMWGSDMGNTTGTYAELIELALAAGARLTPEEKRQVFRETGMKVFRRGGRGR